MTKYTAFGEDLGRLRHYPLSTIHSPLPRGMTLVELLVAVSILVTLVAISVPMFKPMLESQKTAGGARTVAMALERARVKAMESGQPCGISFERYTEGGEDNVALRLRLVKMAKPYTGDGDTVKVAGGIISGGNSGNWTTMGIAKDDLIQFNYQGKYYPLSATMSVSGAPDMTNVPYKIIRKTQSITNLRSVLAPAVVMPRGTVVDLQYSGYDSGTQSAANTNPVGIMFSPNGAVDQVHFQGAGHDNAKLVYFCVGEWERGIGVGHEDGKSNILVPTSFWVMVNAKNGEVRTIESASCATEYAAWQKAIDDGDPQADIDQKYLDMISASRKFAREHYVNLGGN